MNPSRLLPLSSPFLLPKRRFAIIAVFHYFSRRHRRGRSVSVILLEITESYNSVLTLSFISFEFISPLRCSMSKALHDVQPGRRVLQCLRTLRATDCHHPLRTGFDSQWLLQDWVLGQRCHWLLTNHLTLSRLQNQDAERNWPLQATSSGEREFGESDQHRQHWSKKRGKQRARQRQRDLVEEAWQDLESG